VDDYHRLLIIETVLATYRLEVSESWEWWHGSEEEEKSALENIDRALSATRAMLNRKRPKKEAHS
jgi:hypothetical protein